ncbi:MAG TPA: c-type cytochrome [Paracoccaceae bacterium]
MSRFREVLLGSVLALAMLPPAASAERLGLGRAALPEELAAWDIDVRPDGLGLPEGSGSVAEGEEIFSEKCAACHGEFGEGVDNWPKLAGGMDSLSDDDPQKTIGSYWPNLSTAWDYVHRAMPFGSAQTLADDEVYAIVAYLLFNNDLVDDEFVLSRENFLSVEMPNAAGFFVDDRDATEVPAFTREPCMQDCKASVEITMHASVLDVTPDTPTGEAPAVETAAGAVPVQETAAETAPADPALVGAGARVFKKCAACHRVGDGAKSGTGPVLNGIVGRVAGMAEGFNYSRPMTEAGNGGLVWDAAALDAYLADPKAFMPRNKMSFAGLKDQEDRAAVIAYLATFAH